MSVASRFVFGFLAGSLIMLTIGVAARGIYQLRRLATDSKCMSNLKGIWASWAVYTSDFEAGLPTLEALVSQSGLREDMLACPWADSACRAVEDGSYVFYPAERLPDSEDSLLAWELPANHEFRSTGAVFASGRSEFIYDSETLIATIQATHDTYAAERERIENAE